MDKKRKKSNTKFTRTEILLSLPGIGKQYTTTVTNPVSKTAYEKIKIGITNNIYKKQMNNKENTLMTYKMSWLLNTAASGHFGHNKTEVQKKEDKTRNWY